MFKRRYRELVYLRARVIAIPQHDPSVRLVAEYVVHAPVVSVGSSSSQNHVRPMKEAASRGGRTR